MFRDYSMLILTSYEIGEVHFRFLGTNGFHVKAKNGRFIAAGLRWRQNHKYENFPSLFGQLRQKIAAKSVPHVQHDYFFLTHLIQPIKLPITDDARKQWSDWLNKEK